MRTRIVLIFTAFIVISILTFVAVRSQSKRREYPLNDIQKKAFEDATKNIEQLQSQLNDAIKARQSLLGAFALSAGLREEEFPKFKLEKDRDGNYKFIELTPEEQKKASEQSQQQK